MNISDFYTDLMNVARTRAEVDNDFTSAAYLAEIGERLSDAEEIEDLTPLHFEGRGVKGRRLAVHGYDLGDADDSVALAVLFFEESPDLETLTASEIERQFKALESFLVESLAGKFQEGRDESTAEYELAENLRRKGRAATRYRLYLVTNSLLSQRAKDLPMSSLGGIPVEYHVWDVGRLHQIHESTRGREELTINLREWLPDGLEALRVSDGKGATTTYLCAVPARLLSDLYGRYGSRLLEGNVRSYLSARGKVNKGIKTTVLSEPDRFLAYNNGITATAIGVETSADGRRIMGMTDLQIVNGGQTTASLFYVDREAKQPPQFYDVSVQAKIVVVTPDRAQELVPNISRYANSQNKVSEADFFSNSPFHVRLEELSRRILTPPRPGIAFQSKWFYERTRGQYMNEKAKLSTAEEKKFLAQYPRTQVVTKTDAAKYIVSWAGKPHVVSSGAQKNFVAFAGEVAARWEHNDAEFNETYFKHLIAKSILFNTLRGQIAKQDWYQSGYLANIVSYTIAKMAQTVAGTESRGEFNFDAVWQRQQLTPATLSFGLRIAAHVAAALTAEDRPVTNVTEWAKRAECWDRIQELKVEPDQAFLKDLLSGVEAKDERRNARVQQKVDTGIQGQAAILAIPSQEWVSMQQFAAERRLLSPTDAGILALVTGARPGLPSERQAARLLEFRQRVLDNGYAYFD